MSKKSTAKANPCPAAGALRWHHAGVDENAIQRLEGLRPALKREWEKLLRSEPTLSPLGNPDTLVYLMDESIGALVAGLRARSLKHASVNARALLAPLQRHCACGLNPLLNYYATGEIALHIVAAPALGGVDLDEALICYHALARKEIDVLCAVCLHRTAGSCATPVAGAPQTPSGHGHGAQARR